MDNPAGGAEPLIVQAVHGETQRRDTVVVPASDAPQDLAEARLAKQQVAQDPVPSTASTVPVPIPTAVTQEQVLPGEPLVPLPQVSATPAAPGPPIDVQPRASQQPVAAPVVTGATLPTELSTAPAPQVDSKRADNQTLAAETEKARAQNRELAGVEPEGTIVAGMEDDQLWALLRRFDMVSSLLPTTNTQQVNHVLQPARDTPNNQPDLRMTNLPDVPFRNDTLKSNFERVIAAIGPPSTRGVRELMRITDWDREWQRTAMYCTAYFTAWAFGYTAVGLLSFFTVLVCFPGTRRYLFPPEKPPPGKPVSATDPSGKKGDESFVGSTDGIQTRSKTEQAQQQAFEARAMFEAYAQAVIVGHRGPKGNGKVGAKDLDPEDTDDDAVIRDQYGDEIGRRETADQPQSRAEADAEIGGQRVKATKRKDADKVAKLETKRKRDKMVNKAAKMTETGLGSVADVMEILQK